ncbi:MAG: protein kinase, partial [Deltaproteobacteria bacterium]|nr:protein kinase [Deltaproteobacteria bacterium]
MNCPSCSSPLAPGARFCGVCGHRIEGSAPNVMPPAPSAPTPAAPRPGPNVVPRAQIAKAPAAAPLPIAKPAAAPPPGAPGAAPVRPALGRARSPVADPYVGQTLNGRFHVDGKLGEGGFGAVYKGTQLGTNRKIALKLLHPEMTKDENLVARFRREGLVLCNLRDAHTITTYDFDQTPDGTLYIAMELLEGKSLHQVFHDEAPLAWRRMFKILGEMCSSLAEAHAQGIVHRDLKPENIYLENRPGNPEFVKILDFGIAKVMRGEGMDPNAPQLTATGQTLGTLEYMSPEQLMGKPLDGRSDVYALGVLAYELMTGRLPFPDAKGPAGLITAQLKQTPKKPSEARPDLGIPPGVDAVIGKCLEKAKDNRFPDVTALANAAAEVLATGAWSGAPAAPGVPSAAAPAPAGKPVRHAVAETVRGEPGQVGA